MAGRDRGIGEGLAAQLIYILSGNVLGCLRAHIVYRTFGHQMKVKRAFEVKGFKKARRYLCEND